MGEERRAAEVVREGEAIEPRWTRTLRRLEGRRRAAPGSARRRRLFDRLGLADPYDPDARPPPLELGPVSLQLGRKPPAAASRGQRRSHASVARDLDLGAAPARERPEPAVPAARPSPPAGARPRPAKHPAPADLDRTPPHPSRARPVPRSGRVPVRRPEGAAASRPPPDPADIEARKALLRRVHPAPAEETAAPAEGKRPEGARPARGREMGLDDLLGFSGPGRR